MSQLTLNLDIAELAWNFLINDDHAETIANGLEIKELPEQNTYTLADIYNSKPSNILAAKKPLGF